MNPSRLTQALIDAEAARAISGQASQPEKIRRIFTSDPSAASLDPTALPLGIFGGSRFSLLYLTKDLDLKSVRFPVVTIAGAGTLVFQFMIYELTPTRDAFSGYPVLNTKFDGKLIEKSRKIISLPRDGVNIGYLVEIIYDDMIPLQGDKVYAIGLYPSVVSFDFVVVPSIHYPALRTDNVFPNFDQPLQSMYFSTDDSPALLFELRDEYITRIFNGGATVTRF